MNPITASIPYEGTDPRWFAAWQAAWQAKREARRAELQRAFERGLVARECIGTRLETIWTTEGNIRVYGVEGRISVGAAFIDRCQGDPAYLAEHLENRENGFGWTLEILHAGR